MRCQPDRKAISDRIESMLSGQIPNEIRLLQTVWTAVGAQKVVVPDFQRSVDVRTLPGVPGEIGLGLALHQSPVEIPANAAVFVVMLALGWVCRYWDPLALAPGDRANDGIED